VAEPLNIVELTTNTLLFSPHLFNNPTSNLGK